MIPEDLCKSGTESGHQRALFCWSSMPEQRVKWPELRWMFAIPNGGGRSMAQGSILKAEGVKAGISDLMLPFARHGYHGFFIEMKKPGDPAELIPGDIQYNAKKIKKGTESDLQKEFGTFLMDQGYLYLCAFHWETARDAIIWYMEA